MPASPKYDYRRFKRPRWLSYFWWAAIGLTGSIIFIALFGSFTYPIGPFSVQVTPSFGVGETRLSLPPLGAIHARTHRSPLVLEIELRAVDIGSLEQLAATIGTTDDAIEGLSLELMAALRHFIWRLLALSLIGALAFSALVSTSRPKGKRFWVVGTGVTASLATATFLLGFTWFSYDPEAFREPDYSGILIGAPWMLDLAERALVEADRLGDRLAAITAGLQEIFSRVDQLEPVAARAGERLILLVSDIHNNPAGVELVRSVAQSFQVDMVIDAGDLTDWGTIFEARLLHDLSNIPVPYILIPGNHDSLSFLNQMETLPNVHVIWFGELEIDNVRIAGIADPSAYDSSPRIPTTTELQQAGDDLLSLVNSLPEAPDIVAVHHPNLAAVVADRVPLIVSGHSHRTWIRNLGSSVWLNPGSTGAAGIRGLLGDGEIPYTLMLVHLARGGDDNGPRWIPIVVDLIEVSNFRTGFSLERHILAPPLVDDTNEDRN